MEPAPEPDPPMELAPKSDMWTCPVDGCGHQMKKVSAGRRAHMLRKHANLCLRPCPVTCQHGCLQCVPDKVLYQGKAVSSSTKLPLGAPSATPKRSQPSGKAKTLASPPSKASSSRGRTSTSSSKVKPAGPPCKPLTDHASASSSSPKTPRTSESKSASGKGASASSSSAKTPRAPCKPSSSPNTPRTSESKSASGKRASASSSSAKTPRAPCKLSSQSNLAEGHHGDDITLADIEQALLPTAAGTKLTADWPLPPPSVERGQAANASDDDMALLDVDDMPLVIFEASDSRTCSTEDTTKSIKVLGAKAKSASLRPSKIKASITTKQGAIGKSLALAREVQAKVRSLQKKRLVKLGRVRTSRIRRKKCSRSDAQMMNRMRKAIGKMGCTESLPKDVSRRHESRQKLKFHVGNGYFYFSQPERFQVTVQRAGGDIDACAHIARLCYVKFMEGASKAEVIKYRDELCSLLPSSKEKPSPDFKREKNQRKRDLITSPASDSQHDSKRRDMESSGLARSSTDDQEFIKDLEMALLDGDQDPQPSPSGQEHMEECSLEPEQCKLEAPQLLSLLRKGANVEAVLRGVTPACQADILSLIEMGTSSSSSKPAEKLEVPLGVEKTMADEQRVFRAGKPDIWTEAALARDIDWPLNCELPPLSRSGPSGGLGPTDDFSLGVIVGPSGSGVTRLLLRFAEDLGLPSAPLACFGSDEAVASHFEDAVSTLPMVGLNSVPAWMRPYQVLSNGQQQRVRLGLYMRSGAVIDDFGSGIGKQEVRSVATAIGKFIRKRCLSKVLIGTHSQDAVPFLQPDFVICVDGKWGVNPNPPEQRCVKVALEPAFMGRLQQPGDDLPLDATDAYEYTAVEAWPGAVKVKSTKLEVSVQIDRRTIDAANAFEHDFEGTATCDIPVLPESRLSPNWLIGLVVGPSGTGKTTTIRRFCGTRNLRVDDGEDPEEGVTVFSHVAAACDSADMAEEVLEVCHLARSCWLAKFESLSRSELWRARLATRLAASHRGDASLQVVVVDEFTTQLDRLHAQILCKALSIYVHRHGVRLLCATVHDDVVPWLRPCWIFDTARAEFACPQGNGSEAGDNADEPMADEPMDDLAVYDPTDASFWDPPVVCLRVQQVSYTSVQSLWHEQFKVHHYLTGSLSCLSGGCFVVQEQHTGSFVALHASSVMPGAATAIKEHRLVVRPEWQGFGIGPRLSNLLASRWSKAMAHQNRRFFSKTAHPRLGEFRQNDPCWCPYSSNLRVTPGDLFGDMGTFDRVEKLPSFKLSHGSTIRVARCQKEYFRVSVMVPFMHLNLNIEIPMTEEKSIQQVMGLNLTGSKLIVADFDVGGLADGGSDWPDSHGWWEITKINKQQVSCRDEVCQVLDRFACVDSMVLHCMKLDQLRGPDRGSQLEAEHDLEWIYSRCVAQDSLQAEVHQVYLLSKSLRQRVKVRRRDPSASQRPDIPALFLEVSPDLQSAAEKFKPSKKDRICYSHFYFDEDSAGDKPRPSLDGYQLWMLVRVPEFRETGCTHQAAIQAAMAEWPVHWVGKFSWSEVEDSCGPREATDSLSLCGGIVLDRDCKVLEVTDDSAASLQKLKHYLRSGRVRVTAIRRGNRKISVGSLDDVSSGMLTLQELEDEDFWLYFERLMRSSLTGKSKKSILNKVSDAEHHDSTVGEAVPDVE